MGNFSRADVLARLPESLRNELITFFNEISINFREGRWEPSELNGGKLCEVVYSIIRGQADGTLPSHSSKPRNMLASCQGLEQEVSLPRSLRIQIPRMIVALYEIRNNRGVGHVSPEINPNHMDAVAVVYMSKWIVAELVRFYHDTSTEEATRMVDALVEREIQVVWSVDDRKRVLREGATLKEKTLLLLYSEASPIHEGTLCSWVEAKNPTSYRRDVLRVAHKENLIDYDDAQRIVRLSPVGARYVEENVRLVV